MSAGSHGGGSAENCVLVFIYKMNTMNEEEKKKKRKDRRAENQRKRRAKLKRESPEKAQAIQQKNTESHREKRKQQEEHKKLVDAVAEGEKEAADAKADRFVLVRLRPGYPGIGPIGLSNKCADGTVHDDSDDDDLAVPDPAFDLPVDDTNKHRDLTRGASIENVPAVSNVVKETPTQPPWEFDREKPLKWLRFDEKGRVTVTNAEKNTKSETRPTVKQLAKELRRLSWAVLRKENRWKAWKLRRQCRELSKIKTAVSVSLYNKDQIQRMLRRECGGCKYDAWNKPYCPRKKLQRLRKVSNTRLAVTPHGEYYGERFFGYPNRPFPTDIPRDSKFYQKDPFRKVVDGCGDTRRVPDRLQDMPIYNNDAPPLPGNKGLYWTRGYRLVTIRRWTGRRSYSRTGSWGSPWVNEEIKKPIQQYIPNPLDWHTASRFNQKLGNRVLYVADPYRTQKMRMYSVARKKQRKFARHGPLRVFERFKVREAERVHLLHQAQQRNQGSVGNGKSTLALYLAEYSGNLIRVKQGTVPMRMCVSTVKYPAHQISHYMVPPQLLSKIHYWTSGI